MVKVKKALLIVCSILVVIAFLIGGFHAWYFWIRPLKVYEFSLEEQVHHLEEFPSDEVVGPITNAREAREKGVAVLMDVYGEEKILDEKPYIVFYDETADAWMVAGSLPPVFILGGTAHIIINGSDGDVLAVWHEK